MSKKKRGEVEEARKEAMEKYLQVKFEEEELQKEIDEAEDDSDSEVKNMVSDLFTFRQLLLAITYCQKF